MRKKAIIGLIIYTIVLLSACNRNGSPGLETDSMADTAAIASSATVRPSPTNDPAATIKPSGSDTKKNSKNTSVAPTSGPASKDVVTKTPYQAGGKKSEAKDGNDDVPAAGKDLAEGSSPGQVVVSGSADTETPKQDDTEKAAQKPVEEETAVLTIIPEPTSSFMATPSPVPAEEEGPVPSGEKEPVQEADNETAMMTDF